MLVFVLSPISGTPKQLLLSNLLQRHKHFEHSKKIQNERSKENSACICPFADQWHSEAIVPFNIHVALFRISLLSTTNKGYSVCGLGV